MSVLPAPAVFMVWLTPHLVAPEALYFGIVDSILEKRPKFESDSS